MPARAMRCDGSASASGMIAAATSGAVDESGPITSTREGPNTA